MMSAPDFVDDFFCLPPLDIFCAARPDESILRLAAALQAECHQVRLMERPEDAFAVVNVWAPDVVLIDTAEPHGIALARWVRHIDEHVVLIALDDRRSVAASGLFDHVLPKPADFTRVAQVLGLVPEAPPRMQGRQRSGEPAPQPITRRGPTLPVRDAR